MVRVRRALLAFLAILAPRRRRRVPVTLLAKRLGAVVVRRLLMACVAHHAHGIAAAHELAELRRVRAPEHPREQLRLRGHARRPAAWLAAQKLG